MAKRRVPDMVRQLFVELEHGGGRIGRMFTLKGNVTAARRNIAAARIKRVGILKGGSHAD